MTKMINSLVDQLVLKSGMKAYFSDDRHLISRALNSWLTMLRPDVDLSSSQRIGFFGLIGLLAITLLIAIQLAYKLGEVLLLLIISVIFTFLL